MFRNATHANIYVPQMFFFSFIEIRNRTKPVQHHSQKSVVCFFMILNTWLPRLNAITVFPWFILLWRQRLSPTRHSHLGICWASAHPDTMHFFTLYLSIFCKRVQPLLIIVAFLKVSFGVECDPQGNSNHMDRILEEKISKRSLIMIFSLYSISVITSMFIHTVAGTNEQSRSSGGRLSQSAGGLKPDVRLVLFNLGQQ